MDAVTSVLAYVFVGILILGIPLAIGAVWINKGTDVMAGKDYAMWIIGLYVVSFVVPLVAPDVISGLVSVAALLFAVTLYPYWTVNRLRDTGDDKRFKALLIYIPLFGIVYTIMLMLRPTRAPSA